MKLDKKSLIRWKIYLDRARMYIGYINFFMIIVVFINSLGDNKYGHILVENSFISIPVLIILFTLFSLVLGYFDSKLGIRSEEMRNISSQNPVMMEMMKKLNEIDDRMLKIEKSLYKKED